MTAISVKGLTKKFTTPIKEKGFKGSLKAFFSPTYKETLAVNDIAFEIKRGEAVAFIGPNGAGKSTTLKMLTGILYPTSGNLRVLDKDPAKERVKLSYHLGVVFGQRSQLWYHLPPLDTYDLLARIYDLKDEDYHKRLDRLVELFGIKEHLQTPVRKLSLGERMRCELVGALLHDPEILLLDEPTIGLDIVAKKQLRTLIRKLNQEEGKTIILTSHDLNDVEHVCKRIILINHGVIVYDDTLAALRKTKLTSKRVRFDLESKPKAHRFAGAKVTEQGPFSITYEVDLRKTDIARFLQAALDHHQDIADITVEELGIERIIEGLYK